MLEQTARLNQLFHALSDATRRELIERLGRGPASVSALAEPLDMTLAAVLQHLAVLEASGIVRSEKAGRVRTCTLQPERLAVAEGWIAKRRARGERRASTRRGRRG
ncbi:MAG: metalloregulator ArsR/SmtB family transcription factor [Sorangiineae bacterium]|nr:metalloregulator ArsR/SmtB family transcription factor [Polyangiaceae bacterium]MEB2323827.1 metalloregulator ArsR/SmtB family transcription factor [Sorangiineae bacterium]